MMTPIPTRYLSAARVVLLVALVLAVLAAAAAAGAVVNGWRLNAAHGEDLAERDATINRLSRTVLEQSNAVELARVQTEAGEQRRLLAEQYAADVLKRIDRRSAQVAQSKATDCKGVLFEQWSAQ